MILLSVTGNTESRSRGKNGGESIHFPFMVATQPESNEAQDVFVRGNLSLPSHNIAMLQPKA